MCSFLITNLLIKNYNKINYKLKFRGPDHTNIVKIENITFIHNLLSVTGIKTIQPFINNNIIIVYNGEIYNYKTLEKKYNKKYSSDGECLIDLYKEYGENFAKHIHGEFAIVICDLNSKKMIIATDVFSTKPLYLSFENNKFAISTYEHSIRELGLSKIYKCQNNSIFSVDLNDFKFRFCDNVYKFNLDQSKNNFNDFEKALKNAIKLMTGNTNKNVFITMSSGYDSGLIACMLNELNRNFSSYSSLNGENKDIIFKRIQLLENSFIRYKSNVFDISQKDKLDIKLELFGKIDKFTSYIDKDKTKPYNILSDKASLGMAFLFKNSKNHGNIIHLSGQGADEIYCDYGHNGIKFKSHSSFGGKFPDNLNNIFPWPSFFKGTQECFINKEEYIGGCYGIENRYPFLDKYVVQEFLNLSPKLKNMNYKSPLYFLLKKYNFPFDRNQKKGFNV